MLLWRHDKDLSWFIVSPAVAIAPGKSCYVQWPTMTSGICPRSLPGFCLIGGAGIGLLLPDLSTGTYPSQTLICGLDSWLLSLGPCPTQINPSCLVSASVQLILSVLTYHWDLSMPCSTINLNYSLHVPLILRKFPPEPLCLVLASGFLFSRAGGCTMPGFLLLHQPHCCWSIHTRTSPACIAADSLTLWSAASQPANQPHTLPPWHSLLHNPCHPNHGSHLVTCPVTGSWPYLIWPLSLTLMFKIRTCYDGNNHVQYWEHGICLWAFSLVLQFTRLQHTWVCIDF